MISIEPPLADIRITGDYFRLVSAGTGYPGDSEDCLYLNVYTPADGCASKPVMFWIYGGHLQEGTAMQDIYDGSNFAASEDVVVVSANYRTNGMHQLQSLNHFVA